MEKTNRCHWAGEEKIYVKYHDSEWGKPKYDDTILFEFLTLEIFQAGLSWITILRKRENFKKAFADFDFKEVSTFTDNNVENLLLNEGIIRNKLKINATINNAKKILEIQKTHGSFKNYIWNFVDNTPIINSYEKESDVPSFTPLAEKITKELKKDGFKFLGPTIVYSFMQATGMVNDHIDMCDFKY